MKGIIIRKPAKVNNDNRGDVFEWCKGLETRQITLYYRNKGYPCGRHYHKGDDPSKNPERFFLVSGKMRLEAYNGKDRLEEIVEPKTEIIISPGVLHTFHVEDDSVFIESRSTIFDGNNSDTYPAETYEEYIKTT